MLEKRSFFSKTYQLDNGMEKITLYTEPIHYQNSNSEFIDIPNKGLIGASSFRDLARVQSTSQTRYGNINEYWSADDSCFRKNEPNLILGEGVAGYPKTRMYSEFQFSNIGLESYYEIVSVKHIFGIESHVSAGPGDGGEFSIDMREYTPPSGSPTDCDIFSAIASGNFMKQILVDFSNYANPNGEDTTDVTSLVSSFQSIVDQLPTQAFTTAKYGYSLGNAVYDSEDFYNVYLSAAPKLEIIIKTTVDCVLANRELGSPESNLSGTLSIIDHTNGLNSAEHISSLSSVGIDPGDSCIALTDSIEFGGGERHHHSWTSENSSAYSIQLTQFEMTTAPQEITSWFKNQFELNLPGSIPEISIKDPWYVSNNGADPEDWIQPNTFRTETQMLGDNSNLVFEDENTYFDTTKPIYYLSAPQFTSAGSGVYYFFNQWGGGNVLYGVDQTTTTNNETPVVFTSSSATPTATFRTLTVNGSASVWVDAGNTYIQSALNYTLSGNSFTKVDASPSENVTLTGVTAPEGYVKYLVTMSGDGSITYSTVPITSGDEVILTSSFQTIAAGTNLNMPSNTSILVRDHSRLLGTESQPITFRGLNGATWNGLDLANMNRNEKLANVVIKNASVGIALEDSITYCNIQNVLVDSAGYGFDSQVHITGLISIEDSEFKNISTAGIYCATEEGYLVDTLVIKDCTIASSTAGQGAGILMSPLMLTAYGNFKYIDITGVDIDGFSRGIAMEFHSGLYDNPILNWQSDFSRVRLNNNRIENCTGYGIRILGEHALFAHHNIIANCDTAYYVKSESGRTGHGQDGYSHRILNETIVDNTFGVYFEQLTSGWETVGCLGASLFYGNTTNMDLNNDLVDQDNLTSNPLFVHYTNGDYNLTSSSPGVDAGIEDFDDDTNDWTTDTDDQDADGTRMDAGALFFNPAPQAPVLSLQAISGNNPVLSWELSATGSGYPDRDIDHYTIYKRYYTSKFNDITSYVYNHASQSYTDYGFGVNPSGSTTAYYKVLAIDEVNKSSGWSNTTNTKGYIAMKSTVLPDTYEMQAAYPNPFNPISKVDYAIPTTSNVDIRIYDMRGRLVYQDIVVNQSAGWYTLTWKGVNLSGQSLPSGIYIISLTARGTEETESYDGEMNFSKTQKVMLMK